MGIRNAVVESEDQDRIGIRVAGGFNFHSIVFIAIGIAAAVYGVRAAILGDKSASQPLLVVVFGVLFAAAGAFTAYRSLRQSGLVFDRAARTVSKWTALLGRERREDIPFDRIDRIQVRYIPSRGENDSSSVDADLILKDGRRLCMYSGRHVEAVDIAFRVSSHIGLDVEDLSSPGA